MLIYEQEKIDNISLEKLEKLSISIASIAEPATLPTKHSINTNLKSLASFNDEDLYYVQSILVSSSWNKNDDIFTKEEVWAAKKTPEDKPTNLDHDENMIIGHIVSNWPITTEGVLIDELTPLENIPEKFHIITGSVIYKSYMGEELKERSNKLIAEIEDGTKYVSMECMFKGFDYGLIDITTGDYKILSRSEETAFLTKHLRAYGGTGEYDNNKIGRVLRNITFSGKGYVDKPANPDSIILTKNNFITVSHIKNAENNTLGVNEISHNTQEIINTMNVETQILDLQQKIDSIAGCGEAVSEAYKIAASFKERIVELDAALANEQKRSLDLETSYAEGAKKVKQDEDMKDEENKKLKASLEEANLAISTYKMKETEMAKKEKNMKRMASLIETGIDNEMALSTVEKFDSLDDEAFEAMTSLFAGSMPPWLMDIKKKDDKKDPKKDPKKEKSKSDESSLDNVEMAEDVSLSVEAQVESSEDITRAALVDFVYARLGKKLNKGE